MIQLPCIQLLSVKSLCSYVTTPSKCSQLCHYENGKCRPERGFLTCQKWNTEASFLLYIDSQNMLHLFLLQLLFQQRRPFPLFSALVSTNTMKEQHTKAWTSIHQERSLSTQSHHDPSKVTTNKKSSLTPIIIVHFLCGSMCMPFWCYAVWHLFLVLSHRQTESPSSVNTSVSGRTVLISRLVLSQTYVSLSTFRFQRQHTMTVNIKFNGYAIEEVY